MSWYPGADNHNINPGANDPAIVPTIIVVHTMVGTMQGSEARFRDGSGVEAHFGISVTGTVWQWRDTARQADAQGAGNGYCISIETEDLGKPETRWTRTQAEALIKLIQWLGDVHNIPMRMVRNVTERGIGYHRQFRSWNPNNHSCPGDTRIRQLTNEIIPALQLPIGGDTMTDEQLQKILDAINANGSQAHADVSMLVHSTNHHNFVEAISFLGEIKLVLDEIKMLLAEPNRDPNA